jgi:hypothetical protein
MLQSPKPGVQLRQDSQLRTVGTSVVRGRQPQPPTLEPHRVSPPTGAGGAWINLLFGRDPTANEGITVYAGGPPFTFTHADWG